MVRSAGNIADTYAIASLEYAVEHLGVKELLILGHSNCGAVAAALGTPEDQVDPKANLGALVSAIQKGVKKHIGTDNLKHAVEDHSEASKVELIERSPLLRDKFNNGDLQIATGVYHLESGKVEINGEQS